MNGKRYDVWETGEVEKSGFARLKETKEENEVKKNWKNRLKKGMAVVMMACMLLTVMGVNSNAGIMPCGMMDEIEEL